jgi:hypothetical protein
MPDVFLERRREPRVPMSGQPSVGLPLAATVRLVDISSGGVLITSSQPMAIGQRARLQTTLGPDPLSVEIEVRRVTTSGGQGGGRGQFRIGAVFTSLDESSNRSVHQFLSGDIA